MKSRSFPGFATTLFVTTAALCAIRVTGMVDPIAQPHAIQRGALIQVSEGGSIRPTNRFGGCGVAIPCYLHSLTPKGRPIERASQHVSSGFAVDEDWLRLIPTPVTDMALNFLDTLRASTLALAAGALLSGCGGGGGADETATSTPSGTSVNTGSASVDTSITQATTSTGSASSIDTSSSATDPGATASATSQTSADTATASTDTSITSSAADTITVASASTASPAAMTGIGKIATAASRSSLGINLGSLDYYSPTLPTIDLMKKASAWVTQCNPYAPGNTCKNFTGKAGSFDTLEESSIDLDADGWPRSLPLANDATTKFRAVSTTVLSGGWQQAGQYVVRYDGVGTLSYSGVGVKNVAKSTAGRDVLDVINTNGSGLLLAITATTPGNYVRNVRVYPPGGACASDLTTYAASAAACTGATGAYVAFENFPAGSIWHPALLSELKGFRTARFMDWQKTNASQVRDWSQRTVGTARSWNTPAGVPIEQVVSLANTANVDPWVNVPTYATDDYVTQFAQVLHQKLASNLSVNVEYSNEPWNYAFPATHWMYDQAQAAWPAEVAAKTNPYTLQANWYANRLVHVCQIIKSQFGVDKGRVRCIANTQAASVGSATSVMDCTVAAKTLGQPCAKSIDVLAIAPYFGGYIGAAKLRPTVSTWYTQTDGGVSSMFNEIMGSEAPTAVVAPLAAGGSAVPGGSLALIHSWMTANKAVADKYGVPLWAYEGGQGLTPPGGDTDASLVSLFTLANRDPRMGLAYAKMMADWQASGGQTFVLYNDVSSISKYGMWGLKESQFDTTSAKWTAVQKLRDTVSCWWSGC